jgi:hypothetical protein
VIGLLARQRQLREPGFLGLGPRPVEVLGQRFIRLGAHPGELRLELRVGLGADARDFGFERARGRLLGRAPRLCRR